MRFTTVDEVEEALNPLVAAASLTTGRDITTEQTYALAAIVDNPQDRLRVVHVAGTSGKTSTSYYVAGLLRASGKKVGLTVSPHIASITERVQIDGSPLPDDTFCAYMSEFLPQVILDKDDVPSYFEVMMVFALWVFAREKVDYAVVETGLGGLHDSSNICRREDKLCIITDIGFDHTHVLGNTIEAITVQKAGIIAPRNHVVMHEQEDTVMGVVHVAANLQHATLTIVPPTEHADYQDRNFALALAACAQLIHRDQLPIPNEAMLQQVRQRQVPGRHEAVTYRGVQIVRDGAHNEQKMYALVRTLEAKYPGRKWAVVLAMKQSKDYEAVIRAIAPVTKRAIAAPLHAHQDMYNTSVPPNVLAHELAQYDIDATEQPTVREAVDALIEMGEPNILVTGSLYAVAELAAD